MIGSTQHVHTRHMCSLGATFAAASRADWRVRRRVTRGAGGAASSPAEAGCFTCRRTLFADGAGSWAPACRFGCVAPVVPVSPIVGWATLANKEGWSSLSRGSLAATSLTQSGSSAASGIEDINAERRGPPDDVRGTPAGITLTARGRDEPFVLGRFADVSWSSRSVPPAAGTSRERRSSRSTRLKPSATPAELAGSLRRGAASAARGRGAAWLATRPAAPAAPPNAPKSSPPASPRR